MPMFIGSIPLPSFMFVSTVVSEIRELKEKKKNKKNKKKKKAKSGPSLYTQNYRTV